MLKKLIKKLPELYQDIEIDGKLVAKGKRDCKKRWDLMKKHIGSHDVVIDLGSAEGYFAHKIAREYPDSLVISFESDPVMCEIQKRIFQKEGIYNVVVCQHRLSHEDLEKWVGYVDCFDVILALSILHHYPAEDVEGVFDCLQKLSPMIIGEAPAEGELEACGGEAKEVVNKIIKQKVEILGEVPSHLGDYKRGVWIKRLWPSIGQKIVREEADAYFGVSHGGRHKFELIWDGDWFLNGERIVAGVNVWNLLSFNIIWPDKKWWKAQVSGAYECLEFKSDVRLWNLLMTSTGLKAFDYMTEFPDGDQAEYKKGDLEKLEEKLDESLP